MNREAFFAAVRTDPFNGTLSQAAVDGIEALLAAWDIYGDHDTNKLAYILGTAFHESDRFKTMEEYASGAAYEGRTDLGNYLPGDGKRFKGRGFVQITGRKNYADWSQRLGIDLIADPERAEEHEIAARICVEGMMLGTFTGKALKKYIGDDFYNARRVVNGTDRADVIAKYAKAFKAAMAAAVVAEPFSEPALPRPITPSLEERFSALEARVAALETATAQEK